MMLALRNIAWRAAVTVMPYLDRHGVAADQWVVRLACEEPDDEMLAEFEAWVADPRNAAAYHRSSLVWQNAPAFYQPVLMFEQPPRRLPLSWRHGFATGLALLILGSAWMFAHFERGAYTSPRHAIETIALEDGSHMSLNARSSATVDFAEKVRLVKLTSGEGYFEVAHDANRPFIVQANGKTIRAVGTRFSVAMESNVVRVSVVEGIVEVKSDRPGGADRSFDVAFVRAGEEVELKTGKAIARFASADVGKSTAWRSGRLLLKDDTLEAAISRANLYRERPIEIGDPELRDLRVSGSFDVADTEAFLKTLGAIGGIAVVEKEDRAILLSVN